MNENLICMGGGLLCEYPEFNFLGIGVWIFLNNDPVEDVYKCSFLFDIDWKFDFSCLLNISAKYY